MNDIEYELKRIQESIEQSNEHLQNIETDLAGLTQALNSLRDIIADFLEQLLTD